MEKITYAVEQRLRLIDFLLTHYGTLNRAAIMDFFGVSRVQASIDIQQYLKIAPLNATYDKTAKAYKRTSGFVRIYQ